eukprot:TRINITY_DN204_c1_g3_i3.p1 TRINITY_DN204_c1_g3~~TRINITY_DN204_c1_g3_i3.p1  ORF type:complete len:559 (+),score=80.91 TRINITY_DN204_c1_g3_i3:43-1719(+)
MPEDVQPALRKSKQTGALLKQLERVADHDDNTLEGKLVEACLTPPPAPCLMVGSGPGVGEKHFDVSQDSYPDLLHLRPRAQTCVVRKKKRTSRTFESTRFYHQTDRDDPLSPPLGLMGSPGSTQRKRSNVLFSRESSVNSSSPKPVYSIVLNGTPPKKDVELGLGHALEHHLSTFGSVIPSEHFSDDKGIISPTSPTYCDSDDASADYSEDESIPAKPMKAGFLLPQSDVQDPGEIIDECVTEHLPALELFELELATVPPEVYMDCLHITSLDISNNDIHELGAGIGHLVNLKRLMAKSNSLTELPADIRNCKELTHLYLDQNQLRGLPDGVGDLQKLEVVGLDWNEIQGFPNCLCGIEGLQMLYIVENPDLSLPPPSQWRCKALEIYLDNSPSLVTQANELKKHHPTIKVELNQIFPDEIIPHLFLGSLRSAQEPRIYRTLGITYLASIGRELSVVTEPNMSHIQCNVDDLADTDLGSMFDQVHNFIDKAQSEKAGCLVHCFKGQSRSATMVISYLMKHRRMKRDTAIDFVKERRPMINPNRGFMDLLLRYEESLKL